MAFAVLPFIIWAAIRFGVGVTALSILVVAAIATVETALGSGPFSSNTTFENAVLLDVYFAVLSVSGLSLAAVISERENAEHQREQAVSQQAEMEARLCADKAIRESEDRLRLLLDSTAEAIYGIDLEHRCTFCNPACLRTLGYEHIEQVLGKKNIHHLLHHSRADGTAFPVEECRVHRVIQTGGRCPARRTRCFGEQTVQASPLNTGPILSGEGKKCWERWSPLSTSPSANRPKLRLQTSSRKLIDAQEQERNRIGRELHDDISQRLAMLAIELEQLEESLPNLSEVHNRMVKLRKQTSEIAADIQSLSHELHSAKLQYLGIAAAMRGFCQEFGEQQKAEIDFQTHNLPSPLSPDISLSFFRVLQEALHNSAKHSGVRHFEVRLWGTSDEIHLSVKDSGAGFNPRSGEEEPWSWTHQHGRTTETGERNPCN